MPQRKKGDLVAPEELEGSYDFSQEEKSPGAFETWNRDVNPFYDAPFGAGPIQRFTGGVEKMVEGIKGIPQQVSGAWNRYQKALQGQLTGDYPATGPGGKADWLDLLAERGAHLGGSLPFFGPLYEKFLTAKTTPEAVGHGGAALEVAGSMHPEVQAVAKDAAVGGWKGGFGPKVEVRIPRTSKTIKARPAVAGGLGGFAAGEALGWPMRHPVAGGVTGAVIGAGYPILQGAKEQVKSGWRARHPWEGPDIAPGEVKTPYRPPRKEESGYKNPPSTGSQVSQEYYGPKGDSSPLDEIKGETKTPAWKPRKEDRGYRNPPLKKPAPEPPKPAVKNTAAQRLTDAMRNIKKRRSEE